MIEPKFKVKDEEVNDTFGRFVIEPLDPGYGHTLGNALRRILLISIPGSAVTYVKITGAKHKFSTIPGIKENVIDLLLNIKGLNFKVLDSKDQTIVKLSVTGQKEVRGKDLELPEDVEIVNPDQYIATLADKKSKIDMELTVERGYGYSLAEDRKTSSLGVIPTDAIFTPIRSVNYSVSATRVGRQTNLDKLILEIITNGIVNPKDALDQAAKTLSSYFHQVYDPKDFEEEEESSAKNDAMDEMMKQTIDELDLPTRIYNSLRNGGIETIGQLIQTPRKELNTMRNMGGKSISIIEEKLKDKNIELSA
ncbi:MAG: DNA-directed RNA polymerase subunit alpha [Candidatus Levybacteria bacterium RIFCSPLOWO2_01_FULL_39_10]|nr:MAG: DNA-directed RNA polymerase subunit alpha [Candidatus Levybacteria bacterium RIFCSPLOWO2_01_FULL_39_10]